MATDVISGGVTQSGQAIQSVSSLGGTSITRLQQVSPTSSGALTASTNSSSSALVRMVDDLNESAQFQQRSIQFSVDDDSGSVVIRVVNSETKELIRQIPPEEVVNLRKRMQEYSGTLIHTRA